MNIMKFRFSLRCDTNIKKKNTKPFAFGSISGDAGFYTCTGTNHLGTVATSAELVVRSENWGVRK